MPPLFTLRRAELTDMDALVELRIALLREVRNLFPDISRTELTAVIEAHRHYFADQLPSGGYIGLVAEVDGKVIGTGGLVLLRRPPYKENLNGLEGYLMNVYTVPEWRGKGVATAIVSQILSMARRSGAKRVWLHAEPEATRIYEKAGFVSKSSEMEIFL